tara:strand:- start:12095 stop:13498 length:1404 start_codon:yes stop_codon:yes gene_type:complete
MSGVIKMKPPTQGASQGAEPSGMELIVRSIASLTDGVIVVRSDRKILFTNAEAASILGIVANDIVGQDLGRLLDMGGYDWGDALETAADQSNGDFIIRGGKRGTVFLTVRRIQDADGGVVLIFRDLEVFDHQRRVASGLPRSTQTPGFERKVRPDFAYQRQLSGYLDQMISRGERALLQDARVIITGDSGVGKTEIARHLHNFVADASDPFVVVNCAAIPETLFESELFGYEKGAFTGALSSGKSGLIEQAEGGTLFLDEVGEIPLHLQAKMLNFLEDGTVQRVGAVKQKQVHVRIISATNRDLETMANERTFRRDLYYRLAVVRLPIRPLKDQPALVSHLIDRFLEAINRHRKMDLVLSDALRQKLCEYDYPGNIRELYNLMQQISVLSEEDEIPRRLDRQNVSEPEFLTAQDALKDGRGLKQMVADYEFGIIQAAISKFGSKRKAAAALDVDIGTIVRKTKKRTM